MGYISAPLVPDQDLADAVAAFPDWLAGDVRNWVRQAEDAGRRFDMALDAVAEALAALDTRDGNHD